MVTILTRDLQRTWGQIELESLVWYIDFVWPWPIRYAIVIYLNFVRLWQLCEQYNHSCLEILLYVSLELYIWICWLVIGYKKFWEVPYFNYHTMKFSVGILYCEVIKHEYKCTMHHHTNYTHMMNIWEYSYMKSI